LSLLLLRSSVGVYQISSFWASWAGCTCGGSAGIFLLESVHNPASWSSARSKSKLVGCGLWPIVTKAMLAIWCDFQKNQSTCIYICGGTSQVGFSFVTKCGLVWRKEYGHMGMLLDASLEHPSSTRCDCLVSSELSWSEMFRTNLELKLVLLNAFNTIWESGRN